MTVFSGDEKKFMAMAIAEAEKGLGRTGPNPAVGAVIVRDGRVVGRGYHRKAGTPHAEVNAIRDAGSMAEGAVIYVTLEPCNHHGRTPPCSEAVISAGIRRVVIGALDPNPGVDGGGMQHLSRHGIEVVHGCRERECMRLVAPFVKHVIHGLPWVVCKVACSMDGRTATRTGHSKWITNSRARKEGHRLRNRLDAILVGRGTVEADDPSLTCRMRSGRDPARIILDTRLSCSPEKRIFNQDSHAPTFIACHEDVTDKKMRPFVDRGVKCVRLPSGRRGGIDLKALLARLGEMGIQSVLVEGGGRVHGSFWDSGLVDEAFFFYAPKIIGGLEARAAIGGEGTALASEAPVLKDVRHRRLDDNWMISGIVAGHLSFLWDR